MALPFHIANEGTAGSPASYPNSNTLSYLIRIMILKPYRTLPGRMLL